MSELKRVLGIRVFGLKNTIARLRELLRDQPFAKVVSTFALVGCQPKIVTVEKLGILGCPLGVEST